MHRIRLWLIERLWRLLIHRVACTRPGGDEVINVPAGCGHGNETVPYIRRWFVIPKNRWLQVYLHETSRDDYERALHDHPWWNVSVILKGGYLEHDRNGYVHPRLSGDVVFRRATDAHRLTLFHTGPREGGALGKRICWSLFITGPESRDWGFLCPQGWVYWRDHDENGSRCEGALPRSKTLRDVIALGLEGPGYGFPNRPVRPTKRTVFDYSEHYTGMEG